jgi:Cytidylate kinase-like family
MSGSATATAPIICISLEIGAEGEAVGRIVADELGYRYVDEELVSRAAQKAGVKTDLVADVEQRKTLLRRLVEDVGDLGASKHPGAAPGASSTSDDFRRLIQDAIRETASRKQVVIVAHGASIALAGAPGVLRVLIVASPDVRARRLEEERSLSADDAQQAVRASDNARAEYLKAFYDVKHELPTHYDVVISTDVLAPETAARIVLAAAGRA